RHAVARLPRAPSARSDPRVSEARSALRRDHATRRRWALTRGLSALLLLPVVLRTIWFLPSEGPLALAPVAAGLAFTEYCQLARALGIAVAGGIGGAAVAIVCFEMWFADRGPFANWTHLVLVAAMLVIGASAVGRGRPFPSVLADVGATIFAPV